MVHAGQLSQLVDKLGVPVPQPHLVVQLDPAEGDALALQVEPPYPGLHQGPHPLLLVLGGAVDH